MSYSPLLSEIKSKIDRAKVVSFDVFDTLLLRPYLAPTDLFLHIEKARNMPFFLSCRVEAEKEARQKNPAREDITYDEIYEEIDEIFKPLKQVELDWEMRVLTENPEMKQVWDYAKKTGKKIVIASDMYLPTDFIADVLEKKGFGDYDKIYVSGELGKTKAKGTMYSHILEELKLNPKDVLHIGDNKHSDYRRAKKYGIPAVRYYQVSRQFIESSKRIKDFRKKFDDTLGGSILTAVLAMRWQNKMLNKKDSNYFSGIGYEYAGPVAYGYTRWIEAEAKTAGLNTLLFVARDGYSLQKIFDTFGNGIKSHYVYAPRFLNLICRLDYVKTDKTQSNAIVEYFSAIDSKIRTLADSAELDTWEKLYHFIQEHKELFIEHAKKEKDHYKNYLTKAIEIDKAKIGIIDTITGAFSSQKLLQNTLGVPTLGFYWSVIKMQFQGTYPNKQFMKNDTDSGTSYYDIFTKNWNFIEFLITAPEYPIKKITSDGKPVYDDNPNEAEVIRKETYPVIADGAIEFARNINEIFGGEDIFLDSKTLVKWINSFCDNPTLRDKSEMAVIKHAPDSDHKTYIPLFSVKIPFRYALRHPSRARKMAKNAVWRTPLQSFTINIISPIKVRMRGLKHIGLHILPKLENNVFFARLRLSEKYHYDLIIGNDRIGVK